MNHFDEIDDLTLGALRALALDEIDTANSGHPGMALDIAPALYVLYRDFLVSDPSRPLHPCRDRFVLSAGHVSALLYAMLHLSGYDLPLEELKRFRQLGSKCPGHPEWGLTPGVDATSGPLGQGLAQAVGMAVAEKALKARFPGSEGYLSHRVYALCGDGCLEEGLSQEAISFAGLQKLDNLTFIYDANGSTLDNPTSVSLVEDVALRFKAAGWDVYEVNDGNDLRAIHDAIEEAVSLKENKAPSLVIVHTSIGYGSELQGSHKVHGSPLGFEMSAKAKEKLGYPYPPFTVKKEAYERLAETFAERGHLALLEKDRSLKGYEKEHPEEASVLSSLLAGKNFVPPREKFELKEKEATRNTSGRYLNLLSGVHPGLIGGAADVAGSLKTDLKGSGRFLPEDRAGKNLAYGIREFLTGSIENGILLSGGLFPYGGTFLVFSDYMKAAIRMSALEHLPTLYLFSHDSIAVGEDGPTHEPIEQLSGLRLIPGLLDFRPADGRELVAGYELALERKGGPTVLVLSRQDLPLLEHSSVDKAKLGAYRLEEGNDLELIASGSEVSLALEVRSLLKEKGIEAAVVSVPSFNLLGKMKEPPFHLERSRRIAIEMASGALWYRYAEHVVSVESFGASGKEKEVIAHFGFDAEAVAEKVLDAFLPSKGGH